MIRYLFIILSCFLAGQVLATDIPSIPGPDYYTDNGTHGTSVQTACLNVGIGYNGWPVYDPPQGTGVCSNGAAWGACTYNGVVKQYVHRNCVCPEGSVYYASPTPRCSCESPNVVVNGQCQPPCEADQVRNPTTGQCEYDCSTKAGQVYNAGGTSIPSGGNTCDQNCQMEFVEAHPCIYMAFGTSGVGLATEGYCSKYRYTGVSGNCSSTAPPPATEQENCKGQCSGTVNGVKKCVPCSNNGTSTSAEGGTTTTTSSDGSQTTKKTTVTKTTSGGVTTKTTTTTTTTTDPAGNVVNQQTETQTETYPAGEGNPSGGNTGSGDGFEDKNDVLEACKERPDLPICKSICKENPEYSMCKEFGEASDDQPALERKTIGTDSITSSPGFGMCPGDIALPHGATLSMTWVCNLATEVKPFFIAMAWIAAGLIVMGGFKGAGQ